MVARNESGGEFGEWVRAKEEDVDGGYWRRCAIDMVRNAKGKYTSSWLYPRGIKAKKKILHYSLGMEALEKFFSRLYFVDRSRFINTVHLLSQRFCSWRFSWHTNGNSIFWKQLHRFCATRRLTNPVQDYRDYEKHPSVIKLCKHRLFGFRFLGTLRRFRRGTHVIAIAGGEGAPGTDKNVAPETGLVPRTARVSDGRRKCYGRTRGCTGRRVFFFVRFRFGLFSRADSSRPFRPARELNATFKYTHSSNTIRLYYRIFTVRW